MSSRIEAIIKPELLIWARENAGLTIEVAAKKAQVKPEQLFQWETGEQRPTVNQLRKLGKAYKRPLAVFYLPKPPKKFQALRDFRRLPGEGSYALSPNLMYAIRRARDRRQIALDLYQLLGEPLPKLDLTISLSDKPEDLASNFRELLGISHEDQISWRSIYEAFNQWRTALENLGILVFQASKIEVSEMRGFSISEPPLPVIVLNVKDWITGRIFSMIHEFTHVLLKKGGLCDFKEEGLRPSEELNVEVFCNHVAGATLILGQHLANEDLVLKKGTQTHWEDEEIKQLARRYKVSHEVVLRRLLTLGKTTNEFYREKREQFKKQYKKISKKEEGFPPPYTMAISSAGRQFIRLVLNSYYQEKITSSDLSDFLGIRLKHMPKIEMEITGKSLIF